MGAEFLCGTVESSGFGWCRWIHSSVNVLAVTAWYSVLVYFTTINKTERSKTKK